MYLIFVDFLVPHQKCSTKAMFTGNFDLIPSWISDVEREILTKLSEAAEQNGHFNVYNQKNLPKRWHVNNTRRVGPIISVAKTHYGFQDLFKCKYFITINIIVSSFYLYLSILKLISKLISRSKINRDGYTWI